MRKRVFLRAIPILAVIAGMAFLSGCSFIGKTFEDAKQVAAGQEDVIAMIGEERYDEAFVKVYELISTKHYSPVSMNDIAYGFINAGKAEQGIYILLVLIEDKPGFDAALNNLSWGHHDSCNYLLADYYADRALAVIPNDWVDYTNKGNALLGLERYEEAAEYYEKALEADPDCALAVWGKAMILYDKEEYADAISLFEKYAEIDPSDEGSTYYYVASAYEYLDKPQEAIHIYERQLVAEPKNTEPLYSIAQIHIDRNTDYAKALLYYEMILEIDSEDAWAYLYKARCQAQLDLPAEACESLSVAIELNDECLYDINYYDEFASLKDYPAYKKLFE